MAIAILVIDHFGGVNLVATILAAGTLVLVLVRLATTFRENAQLFELTHRESMTDSLTGLGNRRKLVADLQRVFESDGGTTLLLMIFDLDGFKTAPVRR